MFLPPCYTHICFGSSLVSSHSLKEPMKQHIVLFFFILLLSSFLASARILEDSKQGEKELKANDKALVEPHPELKDDMQELIGSEECLEKDEECFTRRMMEEAHLDYIYTQPLPPPVLSHRSSEHVH